MRERERVSLDRMLLARRFCTTATRPLTTGHRTELSEVFVECEGFVLKVPKGFCPFGSFWVGLGLHFSGFYEFGLQ